jgi:Mg-chelatase subunit ChlD
MNPEFPTDPRKALEASLTALLFGELPDDQARFLRQAIATDPELAKIFERLKNTIDLVGEAEAKPSEAPSQQSALKLSQERREELLQRFKTVSPPQFVEPVRRNTSWLVSAAAAILLLATVGVLTLSVLSRSKSRLMAQRDLNESVHFDRLEQLGRMSNLASARESEVRQRELLRKAGENNLPGLRSEIESKKPALTASAAPAAVPVQTAIILPDESNPIPSFSPDGKQAQAGRPWSWTINSGRQLPANGISGSPSSLGIFDYALGGAAGVGGDLAPNSQDHVPILGDVPEIGRMFKSESIGANSPPVSSSNGQPEFFGYDNSAMFVPQPQLAANGPSGVATPLQGTLPVPQFRAQYAAAENTNAKDQPQSLAANFGETQQSTIHYGSYYGGAAFGGYSTIQQAVPQPDQLVGTIGIHGVAEVPVLKDQKVEDNEKAALGKAPEVALSYALVETDKTPKAENGQKLALAQVDQTRRIEKLKESVEESSARDDSYKKDGGNRAKDTAAAPLVGGRVEQEDAIVSKPISPSPVPQPEVQTRDNAFSTFSLNVSDVSFKLAAASLLKGVLPDPASIRSEEFINAFDYRDPEPPAGVPVAFASERARYPFAQNRDVLRFSVKTAAAGRPAGQPLNLVLLLDSSGSMERADRVRILHEAMRVLATQLQVQDTLSVVTFARTARLWVDGVPGIQAGRVADELSNLTPEGGTNLEEAMNLAYQTALRHYMPNGVNRVVLLTDGAANLGDTDPEALKKKVEANRKQGIALDCFGIGWEGYNDDLLEVLTRNGDGRYGFLNTPEEAATEFAGQLAGALHVAASDVKVQVEFNTNRVVSYRQIGYARHQLTKEQFRDNAVDAAEIGAAESGNALYVIEINPQGDGPLATVRVRYKIPGTADYREQAWTVPFTGNSALLEQASPAIRLSATASAFSEWLAASPYATEVTPDLLIHYLNGIPAVYGADSRPQKLEWMIRQAKALSGK